MTRGNQRDLARQKHNKQNQGKAKAAAECEGNKGMSLEERRRRDAEVLRKKQEEADKKRAENGAASSASK